MKAKAPYLNEGFFFIRAGAYFVLWTLLALVYYRRSVAQDAGGKKEMTKLLVVLSPMGIAIYALSQTFAAFDWLMSLQPHWYSTIFGVYFFAGSMLFTFSFMALVLMGLQKAGALTNVVTTEHYHDLGKFMFGFTVFWAYIGFSQFMLIWYANIPEEVEFYYHRLDHAGSHLFDDAHHALLRAVPVFVISPRQAQPTGFGRWRRVDHRDAHCRHLLGGLA